MTSKKSVSYLKSCSDKWPGYIWTWVTPHEVQLLILQMSQVKSQGHVLHWLKILELRASEFLTFVWQEGHPYGGTCVLGPFPSQCILYKSTYILLPLSPSPQIYACDFPKIADDCLRLCPSWPLNISGIAPTIQPNRKPTVPLQEL